MQRGRLMSVKINLGG